MSPILAALEANRYFAFTFVDSDLEKKINKTIMICNFTQNIIRTHVIVGKEWYTRNFQLINRRTMKWLVYFFETTLLKQL